MSVTLRAIYIALILAPILGLVILIPYLYLNYKRNKIIVVRQCLLIYVFAITLLVAFFMTMLPFPSREKVSQMTTPYTQLIPFMVIHDYFRDSGFVASDITTVIPSLKSGAFLGPVFNMIMLLPLGLFLRILFKKDLKRTTLIAFLVSLFFELTQLSGLFFIYPRPYRMFDVDDLIGNTLGAVIGYLIAPYIEKLIPYLGNESAPKYLKNGGGVSMRRRLPSILIDQGICLIIPLITGLSFHLYPKYFPLMYIFFLICNVLMGIYIAKAKDRRSPGMRLMGLRLHNSRPGSLSIGQTVKYMLIQGSTLSLPLWSAYLLYSCQEASVILRVLLVVLNVLVTVAYIQMLFEFFINAITHGTKLYFDRAAKIYLNVDHRENRNKRQAVVAWDDLTPENVEFFCNKIYDYLIEQEYDKTSALRVKIICDSALNDWLDAGLGDNLCALRFDRRPWCRTILLFLICPKDIPKSTTSEEGSNVEMVSGLRLSYESYREGNSYIFAVDVP